MVRLPQALTSRLAGGWAFFAVVAAAALAHLPSLRNGFLWDDVAFITANPVLRDLGAIPAIFSHPETLGTNIANPYYRPLTTLSFLVDTQLWGGLPAGFHATNLLLHLGVCTLLLTVLRRLFSPGVALAAALLFAVHPAHAEPVAYISARADLICAFFLLAAFLAWMRHGESGGRGALALSAGCYFAALLAKITAGLYPAVFALFGLLFFRRRPRVRDLLPFAAAALCYLAICRAVLDMNAWPVQALSARIATAGPIVMRYGVMALSPLHLSVFHDLGLRAAFDAYAIAAWAAIAAAIVIAAVFAQRSPRAVLGLAWFLAGIIPVSGLVTVLYPTLVADRYLYLPLLGAAIAAGAGLQRCSVPQWSTARCRAAIAAAGLGLLLLAGFTMARGRLWRDPVAFWERAVLEAPRHPYALGALGSAYLSARREEDAQRTLLGALEIDQHNPEVNLDLAGLALQRGDFETALWHTVRALENAPGSRRGQHYLGRIMRQGGAAVADRAERHAIELGLFDEQTLALLAELR
jgi:tetratricopeptide (TPR) repeat protein